MELTDHVIRVNENHDVRKQLNFSRLQTAFFILRFECLSIEIEHGKFQARTVSHHGAVRSGSYGGRSGLRD